MESKMCGHQTDNIACAECMEHRQSRIIARNLMMGPPDNLFPNTHHIKCDEVYFAAVVNDTKKFEYRRNDRNYRVGDFLRLYEWTEEKGFSGRYVKAEVTYILLVSTVELQEHVIMSIQAIEKSTCNWTEYTYKLNQPKDE